MRRVTIALILMLAAGLAGAQVYEYPYDRTIANQTLLSAVSTGTSGFMNFKGTVTYTWYEVTWSSGVSSGAVQIEGSDDTSCSYAGTWYPLGPPIATSAASSKDRLVLSDPVRCVRARVSTSVVGGTVTVSAGGLALYH